MVDPFTVMMSSLPSLSQSISPAPPLMDSTMYFFSGVEIWETDRPASWATSLKPGTGDCAGGDFEAGVWADAHSGSNRPRERMARMTRNFLIIDQDHSGDSRPWAVRASKARRLSRSFLKLATGIWSREKLSPVCNLSDRSHIPSDSVPYSLASTSRCQGWVGNDQFFGFATDCCCW